MTPTPRPADDPNAPDRLSDFLRHVVAAFRDEHRSDSELLDRFIDGDQEAFRAIVGRYGRSVWATCLAVLGDAHDAEDAFQAAFVALARQVRAVDGRRGIGPWVRSVARTAARKLRRGSDRLNRLRERVASGDAPAAERPVDESHTWVLAAEELERLPRHVREAVVMYHMEGRTLAQIAETTGCSVTEAHRRVNRGLELLRTRLSARGVALTAGLLAATPAGLVLSTVTAAAAFARGVPLPSPRVAALTDAILAPRFSNGLIVVGTALLLAAGTAAALVAYPAPAPVPGPADAADANSIPAPGAIPVESVPGTRRSIAVLRGLVTDAAGRPVPHASVVALVRRPWLPGDRGLRDDTVARATTGSDGRYALTVPADFATHYPERSVTLLVSGPGLPPTTKLVRLEAGTADVGVPATRTVRGSLVAPDGKPGAGVRVGVVRLGAAAAEPVQGGTRPPPDGWPLDVTADAQGGFTFAGLPAGEDVWLDVRDDRFALATVRVPANDGGPVRIALGAPHILEGRVTAADTGRAVVGVRVSAVVGSLTSQSLRITNVTSTADAAVDAPRAEFDTLSGPDGKFRLRLPPNGPYRVYVNAPEGSPYLSLDRWFAWEDGKAVHELPIALPVGRIVRGVMKDDTGQPVAGGWVMCQPACGNRELPRGVLIGRDAPARTGADGSFTLAVPSGPGWLEGWGPASDYRLADYDARPCSLCKRDESRTFEHARTRLEVGADPTGGKEVVLTLHRGESVRVEAIGVDGKPVTSGVAVCRSVVQPLRNRVTRPLLIREGSWELPGCVRDRVYPVALLDPVGLAGAVAEVRVGDKPVVKLEPCGTAEVRLVDPSGLPLIGVMAEAWMTLDCDRAATARAGTQGKWIADQSWFDPKHHLPRPVTDATGRVTLRALVPGAEYMVIFTVQKRVYASAAFRVRPGETERLPDMVAVLAGSWETQPRGDANPDGD